MGGFASLQRNIHRKHKKTTPKTFPCRVQLSHSQWISAVGWSTRTITCAPRGKPRGLLCTGIRGSEANGIINGSTTAMTLPQRECTVRAIGECNCCVSLHKPSCLSLNQLQVEERQQPRAEYQVCTASKVESDQ